MPTVLIIGPYRFFFYSSEGGEPRHIHVERDDSIAKYWLDPVMLESSEGFPSREISLIMKLVVAHQGELINAWDEYFGG